MTKPTEILVVGSHAPGLFIRVKRIPRPGETVIGWDFREPIDGGKGSNQAIAAARLGARVSFVGCVGRDRIGEKGDRWMRAAGVDTNFLHFAETTASGVGFIMLDADGVPAMVTSMGANTELSFELIRQAVQSKSRAQVLLTQFEIDPQLALKAARLARDHGMQAIVNPAPSPEAAVEGLEAASVLVPNENEARTLLSIDPDQQIESDRIALRLREMSGADSVVITLGERGAAGAEASGTWEIPAESIEAIDTSGAGDVFCAALAVCLGEGRPLKVAAERACLAATLSVTRPGTIPAFPTAREVDAFRSGNGGSGGKS